MTDNYRTMVAENEELKAAMRKAIVYIVSGEYNRALKHLEEALEEDQAE